MIAINGLRKRYGASEALRGVDLRVEAGEMVAYLGPNGAGKTTTIRILTGQTRPDAGTVLLGGVDLAARPVQAKSRCGVVSQHLNLDGDLSLRENLDVHARLFGMDAAARREGVARVLDYVEMGDKAEAIAKTLSGGQKRRAMIARALLHGPSILLLDEPTVGLDPAIRRRIWGLIKRIQGDGATILLTTHYIEEAEFLADRVVFLDQGAVVAEGTPAELTGRLGEWALDCPSNGEIVSEYFPSREAAATAAAALPGPVSVRRVNLEDAFLRMTGRNMAGKGPAAKGHGGGH